MWPEASGLLPRAFGREPDRLCVLELERALEKGVDDVPDAPGELADAVTALRLATDAPVAAGPVLFERLDWRPYGIRPVLPIAATAPPGEPTRLDPFRASVAEKLRPQLALAGGRESVPQGPPAVRLLPGHERQARSDPSSIPLPLLRRARQAGPRS